MKSRVYLETTIPSYLTARPSRDIVRAAEQEVTRTWWNSRNIFELYVSELVVDEVAAGDPHAASQRLEALAGIQLLGMTREAEMLGADTSCKIRILSSMKCAPSVIRSRTSTATT